MPSTGAHFQTSRSRCRDFSCRLQSYLLLKASQQKVHLKGLSSIFAFFELDAVVLFLCRRWEEPLRRPADVAELAEAVEYADELLHSLPRLVLESDRLSGPLNVVMAGSKVPVLSMAWALSGVHTPSARPGANAGGRIDGLWREYRLLLRGSRDLYVVLLDCRPLDNDPGDGRGKPWSLCGVLLRVVKVECKFPSDSVTDSGVAWILFGENGKYWSFGNGIGEP